LYDCEPRWGDHPLALNSNHITSLDTALIFLTLIFWISFTLLLVTWFGYPLALTIVTRVLPVRAPDKSHTPGNRLLTVLVAAHNEERNIDTRISNILATAPQDFDIEILIASDGSTDATCAIVQNWMVKDSRVALLETTGARGKVAAHNQGVARARGDIIVFTDAETEFDARFLDLIGHAFDDPETGFASGELIWRNKSGGVTGENFSLYWRYETWLRRLETQAGIHALGTGACSAVRNELFRPIAPAADQDFITPLDTVMLGYKAVFVPEAKAFDYVSETPEGEFRARVRMTSKNFLNTFSHWGLRSFVRFPGVSLGLVLHKLFRWLTPYFVSIMLLAGALLMTLGVSPVAITGLTALGFLTIFYGLVGAFAPQLPFAGSIWSFIVANAAFAVGVWKAISGRVPTAFR
jgi:cellulose synthase/poly-beta-1,6-N-acetylglucosamine synthase-like glycosyltransferase